MIDVYLSYAEMLSELRAEGYAVDCTLTKDELLILLSGKGTNVKTKMPVKSAADEMQKFIKANRDRLNLDCTGNCVECPDVLTATCFSNLHNIKRQLENEADPKDSAKTVKLA